ncbi:calvin cycle protein CP12-3, chloroplastic [Mercurialis annua]|uniref:calvin cycle protein CP12-3, chloroplastic n=1 Tax=Mercurialis annua TaxID=3986 RepID=UPI00215FB579|nr:calvin cycle protein CP12-3, chloroplastic [Mercurialis annua]
MASHPSVAVLSAPTTRQASILLSTRFLPRPEAVCNVSSSSIRPTRLRVKAMGGGAKFKGTQMREKHLTEMIEKKVVEAKEVCQGDESSDECKVAWDEVEEVSQAKADLRLKLEKQDPLEYFCQHNPETDECRVYQD